MRKLLLASACLAILASCAAIQSVQTGKPLDPVQVQKDAETTLAIMKESGCLAAAAGAVAAPIVAVTVDEQGNKILAATNATSGAVCSAPAPAGLTLTAGTTVVPTAAGAVVTPPAQ